MLSWWWIFTGLAVLRTNRSVVSFVARLASHLGTTVTAAVTRSCTVEASALFLQDLFSCLWFCHKLRCNSVVNDFDYSSNRLSYSHLTQLPVPAYQE